MDNNISVNEVKCAIDKASFRKACGFYNLPYVYFKNDTAFSFLHVFRNW
jgi:hypothetical protein